MKLIKPIMPSLKERKRYLLFKIVMEDDLLMDDKRILSLIIKHLKSTLGMFLSAGACIIPIELNYKKKFGIIQVNADFVDYVKVAFMKCSSINNKEVNLSVVKSSGIVKKLRMNIVD